ncbi:MAG: zinc ribbon domain-containing protein [Planctomycetota bacterium]
MKYKTLFRLGVKLLGLGLIGFAIPGLSQTAVQITWMVSGQFGNFGLSSMGWMDWFQFSTGLIPTGLQVAAGVWLFKRPDWVTHLAIPSNRPYCPNCGYDLSGRQGVRHCPECGVRLPADLWPPSSTDDVGAWETKTDR